VRVTRRSRAATAAALGALVAASAVARTRDIDLGFWIDEGLSVGIADRPLTDIPGVLRLDGSPPLYYMLLHLWMPLAGRSEGATHALSLVLALATIPVAWWLVREAFGARAGWMAAVLYAFAPFLTHYAQETRMYSLVVLLGTVACGAFVLGFAHRRRWAPAAFSVALAALLYTHHWASFAAIGFAAAWLGLAVTAPRAQRRVLLRDGLLAFCAALVLYAPWIPSAVYQALHTGAPWAQAPTVTALVSVPGQLVGKYGQIVLIVVAGAGVASLARAPRGPQARGLIALGAAGLATISAAWVASQLNPAWAVRYLAMGLPFLLVVAAAGLARAGRLGVVGLVAAVALWGFGGAPSLKSNVREVVASVAPMIEAGDLVVSTQPEQVPVISYYLDEDVSYATLWGPVEDTGVTDWRNGVERLRQTSARADLRPLIDALPEGRRLVLVEPIVYERRRWDAPWTTLVRGRSAEWRAFADRTRRLRPLASYPVTAFPRRPNPVRATIYVRERMR
jgi:mannosyltransferase